MGRNFNISDIDSTESYLTDFTKAAFTDAMSVSNAVPLFKSTTPVTDIAIKQIFQQQKISVGL